MRLARTLAADLPFGWARAESSFTPKCGITTPATARLRPTSFRSHSAFAGERIACGPGHRPQSKFRYLRQGPTTKFVAREVPPTQSAVMEEVADEVGAFVDKVTGCDWGGLT